MNNIGGIVFCLKQNQDQGQGFELLVLIPKKLVVNYFCLVFTIQLLESPYSFSYYYYSYYVTKSVKWYHRSKQPETNSEEKKKKRKKIENCQKLSEMVKMVKMV